MESMTATPDFRRAGRSIEKWIGLPAVRSSDTACRKAAVHMWRGEAGDCHFGGLDEPMIVFHTGGAASVPLRRDRR